LGLIEATSNAGIWAAAVHEHAKSVRAIFDGRIIVSSSNINKFTPKR
jgi:hypothetical protein